MNQKIINKILYYLFNINKPSFIYNEEMAFSYLNINNGIIYYKKINYLNFYFAIAHELRHHYQHYYIQNYKNKYANIIKYELNNYDLKYHDNYFIENDATAFAFIMMKKIFNIEYLPKNNNSIYIKQFIYNNMQYYQKTMKGNNKEYE